MKTNKHFGLLTLVLAAVYFLSACGGTLPQDNNSNDASTAPIPSSTPVLPVASATVLPEGNELEIFGIVESMTETSVTINSVTYNVVADLTEFNDVISVGDQVRIHVIVNADGTFTIREIEISIGNENGNGNTNVNSNDNSNVNSNDSNNNTNANTNANSNDANNNDSNTNDDNGNDSNSNDDNSNDDNGNDDGGNDNNNDSGGSGSGGNDNADNDNEGNDNG